MTLHGMLINPCACGKNLSAEGHSHYDRILCSCGRPYWVLRPAARGPLVLFHWPGHNLTRQEMAQKYPDA